MIKTESERGLTGVCIATLTHLLDAREEAASAGVLHGLAPETAGETQTAAADEGHHQQEGPQKDQAGPCRPPVQGQLLEKVGLSFLLFVV